MHVALWIGYLPIGTFLWISVKSAPVVTIHCDLLEVRFRKPLDSITSRILNHRAICCLGPFPDNTILTLVWLFVHRTTLVCASGGTGELGTTNSRAPPAVRPFPMNPGSALLTGEATPGGVRNSMILNPVGLCGIVNRSAICEAPRPLMSRGAVTKTSEAPGLPNIPDARVIELSGTTLASV